MKRHSIELPRCILTVLIVTYIFSNLFWFLNVDLGLLVLTPARLVLVLAGIYCLTVWFGRFRRKEALAVLKKDWLQWGVFGFFAVWLAVAFGWIIFVGVESGAAAEVMGIFTVGLFAFCSFTLIRDRNDVSYLLRLLVLCGVILALLACVEAVIGNFVPGTKYYFTLAQRIAQKQTLYSPTVVFYNPNDFAAFMLPCIAIVCCWMIRANTKRDFLCCLAIALLMVTPTILANSTIFSILVMILLGATLLALLLNHSKSRKTRLIQISTVVLVSALFVLFGIGWIRSAAVSLNRSYFTARIEEYYAQVQIPGAGTTPDQPGFDDPPLTIPELDFSAIENPDTLGDQLSGLQNNAGTISYRKWLIIAGLDYFTDRPLVGNGPNSFHQKLSQDTHYLKQTGYVTNPHCFYVELLSQYGGVLFAMYMGIVLYLAIRSGVQSFRELRCGRVTGGIFCLFLIGAFSAVIFMPSSVIRFSTIWIYPILAACIFCKGIPAEV